MSSKITFIFLTLAVFFKTIDYVVPHPTATVIEAYIKKIHITYNSLQYDWSAFESKEGAVTVTSASAPQRICGSFC